ncbi:MAG TPA: efflux RND transporter periplasmic adaptor subunit [Gemmata sp.]|jgi:RND family efflux transporter MFP subunit|nr:efflux RND transporter periplasmic adaptor subunit [Gemmata sp.]
MEAHHSRISWKLWGPVLLLAVVLAAGFGYWIISRDRANAKDSNGEENRTGVKVQVIAPKPGGIPRLCTQPGSVERFEGAALYAKVFGQLKTLTVDIGDRVKKGDLLAEIEIPEREAEAARNKAKIDDAKAKLNQTVAQKAEAEAEARAADSSVKLATIMVKAKSAFKKYREGQLNRIKDLVAKGAETKLLQDEQEDYYVSALEAENGAMEKVNAEQERAAAARVKIMRVDADIEAAKADIEVAKAELANSEVWVQYGKVRSPCDGVITQRGYLKGDFIKAGDQSGSVPIVTVISTDVMRVVIPVPDRDVPYIEPGKPAVCTFDALPDEIYQTEGNNEVAVTRISNAEDFQTRLMRVEVNIKNKNGKLKLGMYGRATITLNKGAPNAVNIPSAALSGRATEGKGTVRIVRDGKLQTIPVKYGSDNGIDVEILSGLSLQDQVVTGINVPAPDGTPVTATNIGKTGS